MGKYWEQYNLDYDPFSTEQDHAPCFLTPQIKQLLELLQHLATSSNLLTVVTGLTGIGKSTLLKQLLDNIGENAGICKIQSDNSISTDVFRYLLAKHLGIEYTEDQKESFSKELYLKLEYMQQSQQNYIIAFDDAHLLPERTLSAILSIVKKQPKPDSPLHIILFGCPQLETTMADLATKYPGESLLHISRMKPFTQETTEQYIYHRLRSAGMIDYCPISPDKIGEIYQSSGGIPTKINFFAKELLDGNQDEHPQHYHPSSAKKTTSWANKLVALVVILTLASMTAMYLNRGKSLTQLVQKIPEYKATALSMATHSQPTQVKTAIDTLDTDAEFKREVTHSEDKTIVLEGEEESLNLNEEDPILSSSEALAIPPTNTSSTPSNDKPAAVEKTTTDIISMSTDKAPAELQKIIAPRQLLPLAAITEYKLTTPPIKKSDTAAKKSSVPPTKLAKATPVQSSKPAASTPSPKPQVAASIPSPKPQALAKNATHEAQLLKISPTHYTLQLMGSHDKQHILHFVTRAGLQNKVKFFHTQHQGKDWYVAVLGDYPTQQKAQEATKVLPDYVKKQQPWARSIASIQQVIKTQSTA